MLKAIDLNKGQTVFHSDQWWTVSEVKHAAPFITCVVNGGGHVSFLDSDLVRVSV